MISSLPKITTINLKGEPIELSLDKYYKLCLLVNEPFPTILYEHKFKRAGKSALPYIFSNVHRVLNQLLGLSQCLGTVALSTSFACFNIILTQKDEKLAKKNISISKPFPG